ncbi:MAG: hypothetical protein GVY06_01045 [Alphaproteobacteria bacterium]|nr:hypothetical protein [Alphaproteobacteria bacterium]
MKVNRKCILAVPALIIWTGPALAESDPPVSTGEVYACADIDADRERLACYDEAVGRLEQAEKSGEIRAVSRREVEEDRRRNFGLSLPGFSMLGFGQEDDDRVDTVNAGVTNISEGPFGKLTIRLDNGQVWEQIDSRRVHVSSRTENIAEIKRAALGSFKMKIGNSRSFRARRVE